MVNINDIKLNDTVNVTLTDGSKRQGIVKGIFEACDKTVKIKVQYDVPMQYDFSVDKVETLKSK